MSGNMENPNSKVQGQTQTSAKAQPLSKGEMLKKLNTVRSEFTEFTTKVQEAYSTDEVIYELMAMRGYGTEVMYNKLKEVGVFKLNNVSDFLIAGITVTDEQLKEWGVLTANNMFLCGGRFIIPIRNVSGDVIAWVGWFPDNRKYITTATYGFKREIYFFNEQITPDCYGQDIILVEGIFDTLSLSAMGYNVIGNMGLPLSVYKRKVLHRFGKIIRLPDNDNAGMSTVPYLNETTGKSKKNMWVIDNPNVLGRLPIGVKDIDDYIKLKGDACKAEIDKLLSRSITYRLK